MAFSYTGPMVVLFTKTALMHVLDPGYAKSISLSFWYDIDTFVGVAEDTKTRYSRHPTPAWPSRRAIIYPKNIPKNSSGSKFAGFCCPFPEFPDSVLHIFWTRAQAFDKARPSFASCMRIKFGNCKQSSWL